MFEGRPTSAQALRVRVSLKVILDANGERPTDGAYYQDVQFTESVRFANEILAGSGAGWRIELVEIVDLPGLSQWYSSMTCVEARRGIEAAAELEPELYAWRADAINIYVGGDLLDCGGVCSPVFDSLAVVPNHPIVINNSYPD